MSWTTLREMALDTSESVLTSPNLPFALTLLVRVYGLLLGLTLTH